MPELENKLDEQEKPEQPEFFRPDESDRAERVRGWLRVARGKAANLQTEPKE